MIVRRLSERGPHNRFQLTKRSSHTEVEFYREATARLVGAGFDLLTVDCTRQPPEQSAAAICDRVMALLTQSRELV